MQTWGGLPAGGCSPHTQLLKAGRYGHVMAQSESFPRNYTNAFNWGTLFFHMEYAYYILNYNYYKYYYKPFLLILFHALIEY